MHTMSVYVVELLVKLDVFEVALQSIIFLDIIYQYGKLPRCLVHYLKKFPTFHFGRLIFGYF